MKYENLSDNEIISLFEFRIDYYGYIDYELYKRYLIAIEREAKKCITQTKK